MPFQSKRSDARDVLPAPAGGGAIPVAPADSVLSDAAATDTSGTAVFIPNSNFEEALGRAEAANVADFGAMGALAAGMAVYRFTKDDIFNADFTVAEMIEKAATAASAGTDGAVTLRFEAGRDGSRRVRIGVTVGGRPVAEPAVFEAAKAEG